MPAWRPCTTPAVRQGCEGSLGEARGATLCLSRGNLYEGDHPIEKEQRGIIRTCVGIYLYMPVKGNKEGCFTDPGDISGRTIYDIYGGGGGGGGGG